MDKSEEIGLIVRMIAAGITHSQIVQVLAPPSNEWRKYDASSFHLPGCVRVEVFNNDTSTTRGLVENIDWANVRSYRILKANAPI